MRKLTTNTFLCSILFFHSFTAIADVPDQSESSSTKRSDNSNKVVEIRAQTERLGLDEANISMVEAEVQSNTTNLGTSPQTIGPERIPSSLQSTDLIGQCSDKINQVVRRYLVQVKHCHNTILKSDSSISGKVVVEVELSYGKVLATSSMMNSTGSEELVNCIERKIKRWNFPNDCSSKETFPFILRPRNEL